MVRDFNRITFERIMFLDFPTVDSLPSMLNPNGDSS